MVCLKKLDIMINLLNNIQNIYPVLLINKLAVALNIFLILLVQI
jgi:hypothetical protein